tara:strand:- start:2210 stop:2593 length:384 start_codon:yes stop_codon:yes gene_type:complete
MYLFFSFKYLTMQGSYVYNDSYNKPVLVMYKEFDKNKVLHFIYSSQNSYYQIISPYVLTQLLPKDCVNILTYLPYFDDINITLKTWINIGINRLNYLNLKNINKEDLKLNNKDFPTFKEMFKLQNSP